MQTLNRKFLKAVETIHRQLVGAIGGPPLPVLPVHLWQMVGETTASIAKARTRGWYAAAGARTAELISWLEDLTGALNGMIGALNERRTRRTVASPDEMLGDLLALEREFP